MGNSPVEATETGFSDRGPVAMAAAIVHDLLGTTANRGYG